MNLKHRSKEKELLDDVNIPFLDIKQNMHELNTINTWLGGHAITLKGFKNLLKKKTAVTLCEIGCGDGNNLAAIVKWCNKKDVRIKCVGIDIKKECIETAQEQSILNNCTEWFISDYRKVLFKTKPGIIFSSLFCHHFTHDELIQQIQWMQSNCTIGFFINDLHRHPLAYHSIKMITRIFSSSYLVKNDAPLSIARGFKKEEWKIICEQAGLKNYTIQWKWAFRYLVTWKTHEPSEI